MSMATKTRKGPKYLIGKFRPAAGCCLFPYEPIYCLLVGPQGGTHYVCSMFNSCPVSCREYVNIKLERNK